MLPSYLKSVSAEALLGDVKLKDVLFHMMAMDSCSH